jgi:hypothetical protein
VRIAHAGGSGEVLSFDELAEGRRLQTKLLITNREKAEWTRTPNIVISARGRLFGWAKRSTHRGVSTTTSATPRRVHAARR